jgi:hypothetical protein
MDPHPSSGCSPESLRNSRLTLLTIIPVCIAAIPIGIVGLCQWAAVREAETAASLKRDLIDRGLTVVEAERLIHGAPERYGGADSSPYYKSQHAAIEEGLKRDLAARNLSAEEIECILRAWSGAVPPSGRYSHESAEKARKEAEFIKGLVQSGRPAREIERIVRAMTPTSAEARRAEVEAALRVLRGSGMTPDEVVRALKQDGEIPVARGGVMPREP